MLSWHVIKFVVISDLDMDWERNIPNYDVPLN